MRARDLDACMGAPVLLRHIFPGIAQRGNLWEQ